ncbi:hypothetical protein DUI87_34974 [Hirundo rustica rustica]|uniref:Uncharacterized protein n=1 Tax=Hirundo rustica rustica TaxID=333673 RepID=A0A3M0IIP9_HIRRU|nr:hypothetical protein DUI87_34974 [Hirundo rustica rustica]
MAEEPAPVLAGEGAQPVGTGPQIVTLTEGQMEGRIHGSHRYGSDGQDFISFQLGSGSFAVSDGATWITQRCWESRGIMVEQMKLCLGHTSVEGPPKYIRYGWEALEYKAVTPHSPNLRVPPVLLSLRPLPVALSEPVHIHDPG